MARRAEFALGDRVRITGGPSEWTGTVVDVYGPPEARHVVVDVEHHGASGEVLTTVRGSYPVSRVTRLEAAQAG